MKSFKQYNLIESILNEADYKRFLRKNRNLSPNQVIQINQYFSKVNQKAGSEINWQSKEVQNWSYEDFQEIMDKYSSAFNPKRVKVKGQEGEDYWNIRLKNKKYRADVPLNYETAQFMNSCEYGFINVNYCIGNIQYKKQYWNKYVISQGKIPVYVIDGKNKWVVMVHKDNKTYEVWDKLNNKDLAKHDKEPIPNFSIQKELIQGKEKLYNFFRDEHLKIRKIDDIPPEVDEAYNELVSDINYYITQLNEADEWFEEQVEDALNSTIESYEEHIEELQEELNELTSRKTKFIERYHNIISAIENNPTGTDVNSHGEIVWLINDIPYTREELNKFIEDYKKRIEEFDDSEYKEDIEELKEGIKENKEILEELKELKDESIYTIIDFYEDRSDIDWDDDMPNDEYKYEGIITPDVNNNIYDEYLTFAEEQSDAERMDLQDAIYEVTYESPRPDAEEIMSDAGFEYPENYLD